MSSSFLVSSVNKQLYLNMMKINGPPWKLFVYFSFFHVWSHRYLNFIWRHLVLSAQTNFLKWIPPDVSLVLKGTYGKLRMITLLHWPSHQIIPDFSALTLQPSFTHQVKLAEHLLQMVRLKKVMMLCYIMVMLANDRNL